MSYKFHGLSGLYEEDYRVVESVLSIGQVDDKFDNYWLFDIRNHRMFLNGNFSNTQLEAFVEVLGYISSHVRYI